MKPTSKPIYKSLYFQVITAIVIGVARWCAIRCRGPSHGPAHAPELSTAASGPSLDTIDTTGGSLPHRLLVLTSHIGLNRELSLVMVYIFAVAFTFLPLLVGAASSPYSILAPVGHQKLPFLWDANIIFMFLISFPCLIIFTLKDQRIISNSIKLVQADGTVIISDTDAISLITNWNKNFRKINISGQAAGLVIGVMIAYANYLVYAPTSSGYWISDNDKLLPVGYIYLYCIFIFYAFVVFYVFRCVGVTFLLGDIVRYAKLSLLPLHPDKAGGLRPIGRLGLRNQYLLMIFGINIVILIINYHTFLPKITPIYVLVISAFIFYVVLGPFVFIGPLLPFRRAMLRTKAELMAEVAKRLRVELQRLQKSIRSGIISKDDEELIDRLRKVGFIIDEFPVWPFDTGTLRKFTVAYVFPVVSGFGYKVIESIIKYVWPV